MFERYTERSRIVFRLAREEAERAGSSTVTDEHILLGLVAEGDNLAILALRNLGVVPEAVRYAILRRIKKESPRIPGEGVLSLAATEVHQLAGREAHSLNNNYIGTEHLLLGLLQVPEGKAGLVLRGMGIRYKKARKEILRLLGGGTAPQPVPMKEGRVNMRTKNPKKVVLAYSGGLDTSVIIPWLRETYDCEVIAYAADLGQGDELKGIKQKALRSGASKVYVEDLRMEFARDFILPTLQANAVYEGKYLLATSIARPIIAKKQIEIAHREKADSVSHGATGKGNDQVRFELTYKSLDPDIEVIACWREPEWTLTSREAAIEYAKERNVPVPVTTKKPYSMDRNMWHISYESGVLEDPDNEPLEDMFLTTASPEKAPNKAQYVVIDFEAGVPVALDGKALDLVKMIEKCNAIGGKHGIGRVDIVEDRLVGMKSRGVYEAPGATILYAAHRELLHLVLDRRTFMERERVALRYAELAYNGEWFTPLKDSLDSFVRATEVNVTGKVRLKLYKGNVIVAGRTSPNSLYSQSYATFAKSQFYDHADGTGFIKVFGLPLEVRARIEKEKKGSRRGKAKGRKQKAK